ncbi:autophagy protein 13, partial [Haplosporangium sp. Z 767]
ILARVTHTDPLVGIHRKGSLRGAPLVKKTSKWFNLELEDLDIYKEDAKFWRAIAITDSPPPMLVELFLDTSELSPNQMLVLMDENNRKNKVDISSASSTSTTPLGQSRPRRNIILESWSLSLSNTPPDPVPEPPVVYKKSIIFFRSLFAYMRLLPAYQLYRRLRKQNHPLKIGFRINRGHSPGESMFQDSEIGIEVPLIDGETRAMLSEYRFGQVETPLGAFSLKVAYRSNCEFHVDESEAVLSSRFIDMDENYFTPTIVTHSQESIKSSRRLSIDGNPLRRAPTGTSLMRKPSSDMHNSGTYQEHCNPVPTLRSRRNSAQSRSGEYSSSQSSISSLGTRMSRRGSNGTPGGLFTPLDQQHPGGTPPFSVAHGGHAAVAKYHVDPIMESPPFKLGSSQSQSDSRRPLSSMFSPFKSPSLSSSPSPSFLEAQPSSISSRPSSIHLHRSPSSSSMNRVQSSQLGSGTLGFTAKAGGSLSQTGGANLLSTSVKSNASSTSAPRVTSSFGHRHDSFGRRASSESSPSGRANRNSIIGSSSIFQLTADEDDVNAFVRMLDTPEPLKMFDKAGNSGVGPSFGSSDSSLSASALRAKSSLSRFKQLRQVNTDLSESMSASQIMSQNQQQSGNPAPLTITTTGYPHRRSNLSDTDSSSPTSQAFASSIPSTLNRHSQSLSHQPGTPSPLHSEIPLYPSASSSRTTSQPGHGRAHSTHSTSRHGVTGNTPTKRHSWLIGGNGNSSSNSEVSNNNSIATHQDIFARKGSNVGSIAFRHGSLDQGKDILGMEEAMGRIKVAGPDEEIAYGSYPEDVHHQHSLYSAPLSTGRDTDRSKTDSSVVSVHLATGPDPRPIPSLNSGETSATRPGRLLKLGSGSSGASFTLPRLRSRTMEDNESLNEMNSADSNNAKQSRGTGGNRNRDEFEDEEDEDEDLRDMPLGQDDKHGHNTSINDDDDMLFIMSELSPSSNSGQESTAVIAGTLGALGGGVNERGMLPLSGAMMNLRSQSQSPSMGQHGNGNNGGASNASSPHLRLFGRSNIHAGGLNNSNSTSNSTSRANSVGHSRGGSNSGSNTNNQNSMENLMGPMRRSGSGSGSGFMDDYSLPPSATSTPPPFPGFTSTGTGAFEAMLEGRQMSRGGSDRGGAGSGSGSGANSNGHNSFHSDSRGARIEGW